MTETTSEEKPMARPELFISIDIETDGPAPGLNSMLALGAAAFDQDGRQASTFMALRKHALANEATEAES